MWTGRQGRGVDALTPLPIRRLDTDGGSVMSWIKETALPKDLDQANVIRCMSIHPDAARAVMELNKAVTFGGSRLERYQEEAIATIVSATNRCRY